MKIKQINKSVADLIQGTEYLGCGASKEAYLKNGIVYKIPRGRFIIEEDGELDFDFPDTMEEVNKFLEKLEERSGLLVWPIGQFAIEIIVWEAIQQLRAEGLEIGCFAEIKDYYLDRNGVIVIEQEYTEHLYDGIKDEELMDELYDNMYFEIKLLDPIFMERFGIDLRDIRDGNCGYINGKVKLFDFGISETTDLQMYGSYSCYNEEEYDNEEW